MFPTSAGDSKLSKQHQQAIVAAVWRWRDAASPPPAESTGHRVRQAIHLLIGMIAGALLFYLGHRTLAFIAWGIAATLFALLLVAPAVHATLMRAIDRFGHLVGAVVAVVLLTPVFFLVFTGFGLLFRRGRRDSLERWFDRSAPSYWKTRHDARRDISFYERQF